MNKVLGNVKKTHQCAYCSKTFSFPSDLKRHVRTHTGEKPFTCRVCNKSFAQVYGLNRHLQTHTGERPFTCSVCCKAFSQACHLKAHMVIHSGYKPYQCEVCHICFSRYALLSRHKSSHTVKKPIERSSALQVDKRYFFRCPSHLKNHVRTHTGEKPFTCGECNRSFAVVGDLNMHLRTHTGEKPYKCSVCNKAFNRAYGLKKHMDIHLSNKHHQWKVCHRPFFRPGSLPNHIRSHTGRETIESAFQVDNCYMCKCCGHTFKGSAFKYHRCIPNSVNLHVPMSSECRVCSQKDIGIMKMHMLMHEEYKPYQCAVCHLDFATVSHWKIHVGNQDCGNRPSTTEGSNVVEGSR